MYIPTKSADGPRDLRVKPSLRACLESRCGLREATLSVLGSVGCHSVDDAGEFVGRCSNRFRTSVQLHLQTSVAMLRHGLASTIAQSALPAAGWDIRTIPPPEPRPSAANVGAKAAPRWREPAVDSARFPEVAARGAHGRS